MPEKPRNYNTRLAGVTFGNRQENIERFARANSLYKLVRQPDNTHDQNAIMVTANGRDIGYIPATLAAEIAPLIDAGTEMAVQFRRKLIDDKNEKPVGLLVRIYEKQL